MIGSTVYAWGRYGTIISHQRCGYMVRFQFDWNDQSRYKLPIDPQTGLHSLCGYVLFDEVDYELGGLFG